MARRRKGLTDEDRTLWGKVAASATPLHKSRANTTRDRAASAPERLKSKDQADPIPDFRLGDRAHSPHAPRVHLAPSLADRLSDAPVKMHRATHRKMIRGKLPPEARIDLHGMTLARAHPALIGFIQSAHDRGLRLVLVITGKGRDRDENDPIPIRRGVLRHQVPAWLHAPPLGALVLNIHPAHARHGGDGAYYVYLRRGG